jgi:NAD(P)-dependent dehydrogenase (short-subunit alcohol dehydrogenase family)
MPREALMIGEAGTCAEPILALLTRQGYAPRNLPLTTSYDGLAGARPQALIIAIPPPLGTAAEATEVEAMLAALDAMLVPVGMLARDLVARHGPGQDTRIVLLCHWAVTGPPAASTTAAVMGGIVGLARSFALEFAPLGVTANVVLIGPDLDAAAEPAPPPFGLVRRPTPAAVAHAVLAFLAPPAGCITGQVLSVCGGRGAAALPV